MRDVVDLYHWSEHRKLLTPAQSGIAAVRTFGLKLRHRATHPLEDHIHKGCMEIVFLLSGFQIYEVNGTLFNLRGSDIFITYPDEPHSSAGSLDNVNEMIWLQIDLSPALSFFGLEKERAEQVRQALMSLPRLFTGSDLLRQMLQDAFFLLASPEANDRLCGEQTLLCALLRMIQCARQNISLRVNRIDNAISYIHEHIGDPISLEEVSRACCLSLSRFKYCFKEEVGITPREYINQVKIHQAQLLLEHGLSVTQTAMNLGFTTPNYFCVLFKKYTCMTPSEYAVSRKVASS